MTDLKYVQLDEINLEELRALLNRQRVREHLIEHQLFDSNTITTWVNDKCEVDRADGCRVRAIISNEVVAGWCGIQLEEGKYEIAIVLDDKFWGIGRQVFSDILIWAKELGHNEVYIHFLHTRPVYKFLRKISKSVFETEMLGNKFTTYQISV